MNWKLIGYILGALCLLLGVSMLPSAAIAWRMGYTGPAAPCGPLLAFLLSIAVCLGLGGALCRCTYAHRKDRITASEGFAVATCGWLLMGLLGALPYWLIRSGHGLGMVDAYFESISGFTTTGSSVFGTAFADGGFGLIEKLPKSLLFWRALTHWLGGMGIVVLALAILPALRAGGHQLFAAEVPGPTAERLQPRIRETATILWVVYVLLTAVETLLLAAGGMAIFDAICHSFATMATGGFSTKDASIGFYATAPEFTYWGTVYIEMVINLFMFLAGCNFLLHYLALSGKWREYGRNPEFRFYAYVVGAAVLFFTVATYWAATPPSEQYGTLFGSFRQSLFQTLAIITTTGFATTNTNLWPGAARFLLILIMFFGGCAGSTGGGLKQMRVMVVCKYIHREFMKLLRPRLANRIRLGDTTLEERLAANIVGLALLWMVVYAAASLAFLIVVPDPPRAPAPGPAPAVAPAAATDQDAPTDSAGPERVPPLGPAAPAGPDSQFVTGLSAVAATLNNIGPGLDRVGSTVNFHWVPAAGKVILILCMLLGRLEIYSVLVVLLPLAWRR